MAKKEVSIKTKEGKNVMGYVDNGKTYYESGARLNEGDRTVVGNKEYIMGKTSGSATGKTYAPVGEYRNIYDIYEPELPTKPTKDKIYNAEDAYAKIAEQQRKALELQTQQAIAKQQAVRPQIEQGYSEQARQANILARQQELSMPEILSAQGITGGGSESARIQQQAQLGESLKDIGLQKQTALSSLDQSIANIQSEADIQKAQLEAENQLKALDAYKEKLAQNKQDVLSTLGAYGSDYQARINSLQNDNDPTNDWQIPYYQQARQQKLARIAESEASAEEKAYQRALDQAKLDLAYAKLNKSGSPGSSSSSSSFTNKTDAFNSEYANVLQGQVSPQMISQNRDALIRQYGASKYNQLLELAKTSYNPNLYTSDFRIIGGEAR